MKFKLLIIFVFLAILSASALADSAVEITPSPSYDNDNLVCNVLIPISGESYSWYKNDQLTGINSNTVSKSLTAVSDNWKCVVKKYYGVQIGWITIGQDSVTILADGTGDNTAPDARIRDPSNGEIFLDNISIYFWGTAVDREDGALTGNSLVWTSSIDGIIGNSNRFQRIVRY